LHFIEAGTFLSKWRSYCNSPCVSDDEIFEPPFEPLFGDLLEKELSGEVPESQAARKAISDTGTILKYFIIISFGE
jgi:hypothetical protein